MFCQKAVEEEVQAPLQAQDQVHLDHILDIVVTLLLQLQQLQQNQLLDQVIMEVVATAILVVQEWVWVLLQAQLLLEQ